MQETLLSLHRLQQIDLQTLELEKAAQKIPVRISELEKEPESIRSELGEQNTELESLRTEQAEAETLIGDKTADTQKWKRRLNEIKTPREYQALSREVEQSERIVKELEERVMELMAEIEEKEKNLSDRSNELKDLEDEIAKKIIVLKSEQSDLSNQAQSASQGRHAILGSLPERLVKLYEKVRGRRGGVAVVKIDNAGTCDGCQIQIRPQQMIEVRQLDSIVQCPQCSRILVLESLIPVEETVAAEA